MGRIVRPRAFFCERYHISQIDIHKPVLWETRFASTRFNKVIPSKSCMYACECSVLRTEQLGLSNLQPGLEQDSPTKSHGGSITQVQAGTSRQKGMLPQSSSKDEDVGVIYSHSQYKGGISVTFPSQKDNTYYMVCPRPIRITV